MFIKYTPIGGGPDVHQVKGIGEPLGVHQVGTYWRGGWVVIKYVPNSALQGETLSTMPRGKPHRSNKGEMVSHPPSSGSPL